MYTRLLEPDKISHKVWWLREASQIGQTYVKKSSKTQHGRIPIDPAILAAVGRFIAKK